MVDIHHPMNTVYKYTHTIGFITLSSHHAMQPWESMLKSSGDNEFQLQPEYSSHAIAHPN